jgi:hypothetical protein
MRKLNIFILILFIVSTISIAKESMSIDEIIELYDEGVSLSVIIATIDAKDATFYLTTDDIKELTNEGIPDELITYMLHRKSGQNYYDRIEPDDGGNGNGEIEIPKKGKIATLTVNLNADYGISTKDSDMKVCIAVGMDDKIVFSQVGWDNKYILGEGMNEIYRYQTNIVKSISISKTEGDYKLSVYLSTENDDINENNCSEYEIYSRNVNITAGEANIVNIEITSNKDGKPVVKEK